MSANAPANTLASAKLPPVAKGHFLLGNISEFKNDPLGYPSFLAQTYGDVVHVRFAHRHAYLVSGPDAIRQVLVEDADKFSKAPIYRKLLARFLGNGLLTSEGNFWRRQRKLSQPAFHSKRIQAYAQIMVDYTERLLREWQPGQDRDINQDMMRLTLGIVAKALFNANIDDDASKIGIALTELLQISERSITTVAQGWPMWIPTDDNRRTRASGGVIDDIVLRIIAERRNSPEDTGDLLSMLLLAQDDDGNRMSDQQLRDEAVTLILAGHETTANAMTWTWYLLSQHPEVEAKLHQELAQVLGGRLPKLEDLRALEYTDMVIKESMRLYPPIPSFGRQALEDVEIGGYRVPKGTIMLINPYAVHHDPRWYDDPEAFRPERFSKENEKALPKFAYLPFGGGPRVCIGNSFATMEANLILATMGQRYRLSLVPGQQVIAEPALTLRPKHDLIMRLEPRQTTVPIQREAQAEPIIAHMT